MRGEGPGGDRRRKSNPWPLAVCHGWLGSLFNPWVLDLDPTADLVRALRGG